MKRQIVTLNKPITTLGGQFNTGDTFRFLGWYSNFVRLSRNGDNAKLITMPENVGMAPVTIESSLPETVRLAVKKHNNEAEIYDTPHTDETGASKEVVIGTVLAGKDSGRIVMHMTPKEYRSYCDGCAKMAEMYPG